MRGICKVNTAHMNNGQFVLGMVFKGYACLAQRCGLESASGLHCGVEVSLVQDHGSVCLSQFPTLLYVKVTTSRYLPIFGFPFSLMHSGPLLINLSMWEVMRRNIGYLSREHE